MILFHANLSCPGGFVGVDLFFVISGYLITKIIQRDLEQHRFSVMKFYQRRIRRIFPALFLVFLVSACVGLYLFPPLELQGLGKSIIAAAAFCSNIFFYRHSGYFDTSSLLEPLLHTWTLSVEEQFYIFWPLMLAVLSTRSLSKHKFSSVLVILTGSLLLSAYWVTHLPNAAFYLLPSRAWELALGAILSIAPFPRILARMPRPVADIASLLGLAMIVIPIASYDASIPFPGLAAIVPCLGAAFVVAAGEGGSSLGGRILSLRPLVWVGLISYSLYLWHWPVLVFARVIFLGELSLWQRMASVTLIFAVSWLSWRFVESPFRDPQIMSGQPRTYVIGGLVMTALFIVIGFVLFHSGGFPNRSPDVARWVASQEQDAKSSLFNSPCLAWKETIPPAEGCLLGSTNTALPYNIVLWGDSHAAHLAPAFVGIGVHLGLMSRQITKAGCPPLLGIRFLPVSRMTIDCPAFNDSAIKALLGNQRVRVIVLAARWIHLADGTGARPISGEYQNKNESRQIFIAALHRTIETIVESGREVIIVGQVPSPEFNPITCVARARFNHWDESPCLSMPAKASAEGEALVNQALNAAIGTTPSVRVIHPFDVLCSKQTCQLVSNGRPLFWDETHLSDAGARLIGGSIEESISSSARIVGTNNRGVTP